MYVCVCMEMCVHGCVHIVCVCIHYLYSLFVFYRKEPLSASRLFFSLVQTQTTACFELSDFSGCKAPLHWLYGQPPWHTPETEHNGYPQFTSGFTPILSMWVCTFTSRNGVDVGCVCVCVCVCVYSLIVFTNCILQERDTLRIPSLFSLVQTQTTACFELSDFSGCK